MVLKFHWGKKKKKFTGAGETVGGVGVGVGSAKAWGAEGRCDHESGGRRLV